MTPFRFIPLAVAISATAALVACGTTPSMPMSAATAGTMPAPDHMARMDEQMKTMRAMHEKMMNAKTPEQRNALMADHMKAMHDGMGMMKGMSGMSGPMAGMSTMGAGPDARGMPGDMAKQNQMMDKRMDMMQMMMEMMMDRMPPSPARK